MDGLESMLAFMNMVTPVPEDASKVNEEACKACAKEFNGFTCCQRLPCAISPEEVKDLSFQGICDLLNTGLVSIDWYVGDPTAPDDMDMDAFDASQGPFVAKADLTTRAYYLRMRAKNKPLIHPAIFPCECKLLGPDGCMLPFTHRPKGGRELVPKKCRGNLEAPCAEGYSKKNCSTDWLQYKDLLEQVFDHYKNEPERVTDVPSDIEAFLSAFADMIAGLQE